MSKVILSLYTIHLNLIRWGHGTTLVNNKKLLVFGGWEGQNVLCDCYSFDLGL